VTISQLHADASPAAPWIDPDGPLGLTGRERHRLAAVLVNAAGDGHRPAPFAQRYPELTVADAYRISRIVLERRLDCGERVVALTAVISAGAQTTGPDVRRFGWVTDAMMSRGDCCVVPATAAGEAIPHVALELRRTPAAGVGEVELLEDVSAVYPSLQILESRYGGGAPSLADEIADNCGVALLVLGPPSAPPAAGLRNVSAEIAVCGGPVLRPQGDVLATAAAMVGELQRVGIALTSGLLLAVPVGAAGVDVAAGDEIRAVFDGIGTVAVQRAA
jgi:2-keto-4-pentenoate hydratase